MKLTFKPTAVQTDHTGKDFGLLTIQQYRGHTACGHSVWTCLCKCGQAVDVMFQDLVRDKTSSCGCNQSPRRELDNNWSGYGEISGALYSKIRNGANRRGIIFNVNIEDLWEIFVKQERLCALTGWPLWFAPVSASNKDVLRTASLDRIDSSKGYVKKNLRWVHKKCNALKMSFSDKELFELVRAVAEYKELM